MSNRSIKIDQILHCYKSGINYITKLCSEDFAQIVFGLKSCKRCISHNNKFSNDGAIKITKGLLKALIQNLLIGNNSLWFLFINKLCIKQGGKTGFTS